METNKLPLDFSSNVMAAIEREAARREKREERLMYAGIAGACLALLAGLGYLGSVYGWFTAGAEWIRMERTAHALPAISPVWIPVLISSLLLVFLYYYLYERKRKELISHG